MAKQFELSDDEARQMRDEMLDGALPIVFTGMLFWEAPGEPPTPIPVVQLDASDRPDVQDVFRVVDDEGTQRSGDRTIQSLYYHGQGFMEVPYAISEPVACSFKFVLRWPEHRALFDEIEKLGQLFFTVRGIASEGGSGVDLLGMKMDAPEVLDSIAMWRQIEAY